MATSHTYRTQCLGVPVALWLSGQCAVPSEGPIEEWILLSLFRVAVLIVWDMIMQAGFEICLLPCLPVMASTWPWTLSSSWLSLASGHISALPSPLYLSLPFGCPLWSCPSLTGTKGFICHVCLQGYRKCRWDLLPVVVISNSPVTVEFFS